MKSKNNKSQQADRKNKLGVLIIALLSLCALFLTCATLYTTNSQREDIAAAMSGGDGSETNPYIMTTVADWKNVVDRASSETNPTYVQLGANITASGSFSISGVSSGTGNAILNGALNVPSGKYINLDLKNFTINRGLCTASNIESAGGTGEGHVITVYGNLTLDGEFAKSGTTASGGKIMGGVSSSTGGGGVCVYASGNFTMNGGIICYNKALGADMGGGGGGVMSRGIFTLNNGILCNNYGGGNSADGSAIQISGNSGKYYMNGGMIFNNIAGLTSASGGTVSLHSGAVGYMYGGEIFDNVSRAECGAIQIHASSTFNMSGGAIYNNSCASNGGALWINSSSQFVMSGGIITGNKATSGNVIYNSGSTVKLSGSAQFYGNYSGSTPQDITSRFTVSGPFTSAHIGISTTGTFTSGYGTHNAGVSATQFFYSTNSANHIGNTVASLGSSNEGNIVSGTQTTQKVVWKYQYAGSSDWKTVSTAVTDGDKFASFAHESYLILNNPSRRISILPFASESSTTPLVSDMSQLIRKTSTGNETFDMCAPSSIDYKSGAFYLRYNSDSYINTSFTLEMNLSVIFIDVEAISMAYDKGYQNGLLFTPDYLNYEVLSTPAGASAVKLNGEYLQFLDTGTYRIKLTVKDEFNDQFDAGLVGWAETDWTAPLENVKSIEVSLTVDRCSLAIPKAENGAYNAAPWTLADAEGAWCTDDHKDTGTVDISKLAYKNFASGANYVNVDKSSEIKNAGCYRITVKIEDTHNYMWEDKTDGEQTFELTLSKAKIKMNAPRVDEFGLLADGETISHSQGVFTDDILTMSAAGVYGLEYVKEADVADDSAWKREAPSNAGMYYVRPYIVSPDNCNYEIDYEMSGNVGACYFRFERLKNTIAIPYLWKDGAAVDSTAFVTNVPYTGASQTFKLVNTRLDEGYSLSDGIIVVRIDGGITQSDASTFAATNMNTYTVTVGLADPANTRWANGETNDIDDKEIKLIITEAHLNVYLAYNGDVAFSDGQAFSKGEHETLILSAGEILSGASSGSSKVTLDVTYSNTGGVSGAIADTQMSIDGNFVKVNIDLMTLPVGNYTFKVKLRDGISANSNYTLVKVVDDVTTPITEYEFHFTVLTAEIKVDSAEWSYTNVRIDSNNPQIIDVGDMPDLYYNREVYNFFISKLFDVAGGRITNTSGLDFTTVVTDSTGRVVTFTDATNAGTYTSTVTLKIKDGVEGYVLASDSKTSFALTWTVLPVVFDLKDLSFSPNATFDWQEHEVLITNPQLSAEPYGTEYVNQEIWAGNYKAGFVIYTDATGNLTYYCSLTADADDKYHLDNGAVVWLDDDGNAYVEYDWSIAKAEITIGNAAQYWQDDIITDANGAQFKSYLPKVYQEYEDVLDVRYYTDSGCTNEIDVNDITVQYELERLITYYIKVTVNASSSNNFKLTPNDSATRSFTVGSTKKGLSVNVLGKGDKIGLIEDSANHFGAVYSDKGYTFSASATGMAQSGFKITYYKMNTDSGEWEEMSGNPKDVGEYKIFVEFSRPNAVYEIKNAEYYLTIYAQEDPDIPVIPDQPDVPDEPGSGDIPSGEDPSGDIGSGDIGSGDIGSGDIGSGDPGSGEEPSGNVPTDPSNNGGGALDEFLEKLKGLPLWQLITGGISILLIIIFMSKGFGYAGKTKQTKRMAESKFKTYYAGAFLGMSFGGWTAIACVLMGLAVVSLVFMILQKGRYNKALISYEEAKDDYEERKAQKKEEDMRMMFMGMIGNNGSQNAQQGAYVGTQGIDMEDMRMMINETVSALLPGMQQMLPQQASVNDEMMQKLIEKEEKNDETISRLMEQNEKLMQENSRNQEAMQEMMQKLAEKSAEKVEEKEVVATGVNDETIKALIEGQKAIMKKLAEQQPIQQVVAAQPQIIERVVEKPVEKIVEKEVRVEVPVEKVVEKVVEKPVVHVIDAREHNDSLAMPSQSLLTPEAEKSQQVKSAPKKETAPRLTLEEAYAKLTKEQKKYFDGLREYAMKKDSKCKEKLATYFTTIGPSATNPLIKLTIKKGVTVALFKMEDEYLKDIRRNASSDGAKVKVKETEIAIPDAQSFDTAKDMIDLRIDQIERYEDFMKEQRAMKRK